MDNIKREKYDDIIEQSGLPEKEKEIVKRSVLPRNVEEREIVDTKNIPASYILVEFHSLGKFDCPPILHFKDYNSEQLNDITLSYEDNMLENVTRILIENCFEKFDISKCTQPEFIEILGTILVNFWRKEVKIPWSCECQYLVPEDDRQTNIATINLKDVDTNMVPDRVSEPIGLQAEVRNRDTGKIETMKYEFRFSRIADLIYAREKVKKKYLREQKEIDNLKTHGVSKQEFQEIKREKQKELDKKKIKDMTVMTRSQCLLSVNGKNIPKPDKFEEFKAIDPFLIAELFKKMEDLDLGFSANHEIECEFCHEIKSRRLRFLFMWFLPTDAKRELGSTPIFTGI